MKNIYFLLIFALSLSFVNAQSIEITGNSIIIPGDGSNVPQISDDTYYGTVANGGNLAHTFSIRNTTGTRIKIPTIISSENSIFEITSQPGNGSIANGATVTFVVTFKPISNSRSEALITITKTNNSGKNPVDYTFNVAGNRNAVFGNVMISQYYNNGTEEIIEIKNLTLFDIQSGVISYKIGGGSPIAVGIIQVGTPISINIVDGNNHIIELIDTNLGDILDVIGDSSDWGSDISFSKGTCATEEPHTTYDINDWIELSIDEVDNARREQNISLGTYYLGPRIFDPIVYTSTGDWSEGDFDRTRSVVINGDIPSQDYASLFEVCDLTINSTFTFNYIDPDSPATIAIYGDLNIDGTFIVGDTESLVMKDGIVNYNGTFTKIENSVEKQTVNDATYWSSPVEGAVLTTVFPDTDTNRMFLLDPTHTNPLYETNYPKYEHWFNHSGAMITGQGYSVEGDIGTYPDTQIINFTGKPHNGFYNVDVFTGISSTVPNQTNMNYNLIGNPYPCAIDPDLFISNNGGGSFTGTIYVWSQRSGNIVGGEYQDPGYYHYNLTGGVGESTEIPDGTNYKIASGQGFMIDVENTSTIIFSNEMRVIGDNTMFYKSENSKKSSNSKDDRDRIWLRLTNSENKVREQLIGFVDKATDGVDYGYDGKSVNGKDFNFYSSIDNSKYAIQGLGAFTDDKTVALGFDSDKAGDFTISISKMEGVLKGQKIYLIDNTLNITHDLKNGDYKFTQTETGEFMNRFTLQFAAAALGVDDILNQENNLIISNDNDFFKISANQIVKSVEVYDMLGRMIIKSKPNKQSFNLLVNNVNKGSVLVIHAQLENGALVSKKMIKY